MMNKPYEPPVQSGIGQMFDSLVVLVLVYASLLAPLLFKATAEPPKTDGKAAPTWESLNQTPAMVEQWEKLGVNVEAAAPMITNRFDYTIEPISLLLTIAVIVGYFVFVFRVSEKEYREVIRERFDASEGG
jgi:hypothetical protein